MNKIIKFLICCMFFEFSLSAENTVSNYIDNDHRIRNFSFMGPFPKSFNGDSLIMAQAKENLDFNNSTYTFTAPVTGKYYLHAQVYVNSIDSAATYYSLRITTSNKDYISIYNYTHSDLNYITFQIDVLADMDASDTAVVGFLQPDGTAQTDIQDNASYTFFCGHLVC